MVVRAVDPVAVRALAPAALPVVVRAVAPVVVQAVVPVAGQAVVRAVVPVVVRAGRGGSAAGLAPFPLAFPGLPCHSPRRADPPGGGSAFAAMAADAPRVSRSRMGG